MSFKDGRIGVGKDPIFPLDISGSCRIDGDLILGGRFSDSQGNPIQLGSGSGATSTPDQNQDGVPSWSSNSLTTVYGYKNTGAHPSTISNGYNWAGSTWNDDGTITWSAGTGGTAGGMAPPGGWDANTTYILTVTSKTTGGSYTLGGTSFNPGTSYATQTKEFTGSLGEMRNNWGSSNQITFQRWDVSIKNKKMLNVHQLGGVGINDDRVYDEDFGHLYIDTTDFPTLRRGGKDYTSSSVLTVGGSIILSAINGTNSQSTSNIYFNAPNNKFQTGLIWRREVSGLTTYISGAILFDSELTNYSTTTTTGYSAGGLSFYTSDTGSGWSSSSAKRRMVIHGGGNVGIGTTSPDHKLEIYESTGFVRLCMESSTTGKLLLGTNNDGRVFFWNEKNSYMHFGTNNTERMRITGTGNVGIGTTSPETTLQIHGGNTGSTAFNDTVLLLTGNSSQNGGSVGIHFCPRANHTTASLLGAKSAIYCKDYAGTWNRTSLVFCCNNDQSQTPTSLSDAKMVIRETGNVGIGTTSPDNTLQVEATMGEMVEFKNTSTYCRMVLNGATSTGGDIIFRQNGASKWGIANIGDDLFFMGDDSTSQKYMTILNSGNVGIGTTSPGNLLHLKGSYPIQVEHQSNSTLKLFVDYNQIHTEGDSLFLNWNSQKNVIICGQGGNVGIGTVSAGYPLHVVGNTASVNPGYVSYMEYPSLTTANATNHTVGLRVDNDIWSGGYILASSDERIKKNIVDVPDNLALEMVRNIPVRYYEYKNTLERGFNKTIGFIAQDVKEVLPMAVSLQKNIIPNEMRNLMGLSWNGATLYTDLSDCSGIKYRFYVSNDPGGNDEVMKEVVGNHDNTFTFDTSYNNVFCYGKEVDDFHSIDKNKLYTINFSATQELDRKVTALETVGILDHNVKILDLYKENQDQNVKILDLESKIETLTKENQDQNVKILDLYKENEALKARLAKIEAFLGI